MYDGIRKIADRLACPQCRTALAPGTGFFSCAACGVAYPVTEGILDMRKPADREKAESVDWGRHWGEEHQGGMAQKFFSAYRKHVFARTVAYFLDRYFPEKGIFVEVGSGTAETSVRVDKRDCARVLVALDIVFPVLTHCDPVMDARICADGFRLPFRDASLDGIWNLGVMEHFTHDQIDEMMSGFRRVLRPGGRVILFWPAKNSVPQKMLQAAAWVINLKKREKRFRFHPDEISQLQSNRQARAVMARNGFTPLHVDWGFASGMAFKSVVGEKSTEPQILAAVSS